MKLKNSEVFLRLFFANLMAAIDKFDSKFFSLIIIFNNKNPNITGQL